MKLLITGGHITPALAVIDEINNSKFKQSTEIVFVGRKYAFDYEKTFSLEFREIEKRNIKFIPLVAGRLTRIVSLRSIGQIIRIPMGFFQARQILKTEKPEAILSFGGYLALPVAFVGYFLNIPVFTHEQTIYPGLANRIISFFSRKIFISFDEARKYFSPGKTLLLGNPVRRSIFQIVNTPFLIKKDRQVIYVTGGSLGSHSLNIHTEKILPKLLKEFIIIHQTGDTKEYDDHERLYKLKNSLPKQLSRHYFLKKHFFEEEIGYIYSLADFVVGRAGANTFFELLALEKPAVFLPLPWSANKEQQKQAELFQKKGAGEIFNQSRPSHELLALIEKVSQNIETYKKNFKNLKSIYKQNAAKAIVEEILAK